MQLIDILYEGKTRRNIGDKVRIYGDADDRTFAGDALKADGKERTLPSGSFGTIVSNAIHEFDGVYYRVQPQGYAGSVFINSKVLRGSK